MNSKFSRLVPLALLFVMLTTMVVVRPVYAAHTISSVTPSQIVNDVDTTITITGDNFDASAEVSLGSTALLRLTQSPTEITALVPAGVSVGSYAVTVRMTVGGVPDVVTCASPCVTVSNPVVTQTPAPQPFSRPQFVVVNSRAVHDVQKGQEFNLKVVLENLGQATAYGAQAVFSSADLVPTKTGGVAAIGVVPFDDEVGINQTFIVTGDTFGKSVIVVDLNVTYYDDQGMTYSEKFTLSVPITGGVVYGIAYPTATPTGVKSSQLVITNYSADLDPLQPGEQFALNLMVQNVGNAKAQRITMIVGGGSSGSSTSGTPQPGGVSGGSGDFANFAPVGASNVQSLGDLAAGETIRASQNLIVNVSTSPGAYPIRISFSYLDDKSEVVNDEQVITLLVYSLPNVDVSFYRPPDPFAVGQSGPLPIQVVNLGKRLAVLGNMKVSAQNGVIENGTSLIGSLDAGGYFTLDSFFTPEQPGSQTLEVTIEYVDDFNQPRTLIKSLEIEVMEAFMEPTPDPALGEGVSVDGFPIGSEETTLQKIWRFVLGLFGLDSSAPSSGGGGGSELPPVEQNGPILPPGKGG